jgi:hypothetical protein
MRALEARCTMARVGRCMPALEDPHTLDRVVLCTMVRVVPPMLALAVLLMLALAEVPAGLRFAN